MKLYTEEQVREAIIIAENCSHMEVSVVNGIMSKLTPIELPSDEEIDSESPYLPKGSTIENWYYKNGFIEGMKHLRDKIQGGKQ